MQFLYNANISKTSCAQHMCLKLDEKVICRVRNTQAKRLSSGNNLN